MAIKLVIFDLDGTLVDTIEGLAFSMNQVLLEKGYQTNPIEEYKELIGNGLRNAMTRALPEVARTEQTIAEAFERLKQIYLENYHVGLKLYQGILELLDELIDQEIQIAVNTNKIQEITELIIRDLLSRYNFVEVFGAGSRFDHKPSPQAVFEIMNRCRVKPEEVLFVGDSEVDFLTAEQAGIIPILVSWGFRTESDLQKLGAPLVHQPKDILKFT